MSLSSLRLPLSGAAALAGLSLAIACALPAGAWTERRLIDLAHAAVRAEVEGRLSPVPHEQSLPAPVFVTIERGGKVVGCRGSLETRGRSLEEAIVLAARSAAAHDPRYRPLERRDLAEIQVTVTLVRELKPIEHAAALSPSDGLVLKAGSRTGVVLPWEGKDPQIRLQWAYRKAGVTPGAACRLFRLIAERFRG